MARGPYQIAVSSASSAARSMRDAVAARHRGRPRRVSADSVVWSSTQSASGVGRARSCGSMPRSPAATAGVMPDRRRRASGTRAAAPHRSGSARRHRVRRSDRRGRCWPRARRAARAASAATCVADRLGLDARDRQPHVTAVRAAGAHCMSSPWRAVDSGEEPIDLRGQLVVSGHRYGDST